MQLSPLTASQGLDNNLASSLSPFCLPASDYSSAWLLAAFPPASLTWASCLPACIPFWLPLAPSLLQSSIANALLGQSNLNSLTWPARLPLSHPTLSIQFAFPGRPIHFPWTRRLLSSLWRQPPTFLSNCHFPPQTTKVSLASCILPIPKESSSSLSSIKKKKKLPLPLQYVLILSFLLCVQINSNMNNSHSEPTSFEHFLCVRLFWEKQFYGLSFVITDGEAQAPGKQSSQNNTCLLFVYPMCYLISSPLRAEL